MTAPVDDEFTALVDAEIPRVDLVDKAANGLRFLIAKQADGARGLMDPAFVRGLIGKPEPVVKADRETVTMTGSPAAIARFIHQAAQRADGPVAKAEHDTEDRKRMADSGSAMADGSYPIADRADLSDAIHAVGRGGADHDAIRRHIISRAETLGASSEIPDNWNADGSLKGEVSKETNVADVDLDPTVTLAEPDGDAPGIPTNPGSSAWEAVDAATARKWTSILARARAAVDLLADREMMEAASGDGDEDDAYRSMDLQDACGAIDYAISLLAPFAVSEQAEAEIGDGMDMVGKALAGFDPATLDEIEVLGQVRKAGRVLSAANESAIRGAVDSLQKVLASLPSAPAVEESVAKSEEIPAMTAPSVAVPDPQAAETTAGVVKADAEDGGSTAPDTAVAKADGEGKAAMRAVYDAKGRLVGIVDPADITPIEDASPDPDDAAEATEPADADLTPAPAAEVGTPTDGLTKTTDQTDTTDESNSSTTDAIAKSIAEVVKAQLDAHSAAQQEALVKVTGDLAAAAETIGVLKGQVQALEEQPAQPKVFTNGAVPPPHQMRGQDRGGQPADAARIAELRKGLYSPVAAERDKAALDLNELAVVELQEIHQRRR